MSEFKKRITKGQEKSCSLFFMKRRTCDVTVWRKIRFRQSCGCVILEHCRKNLQKINDAGIKRKFNNYDLTGSFGIGYTTKGEEFYFDLEDYDLIKNYNWHIDKSGYVVANSGDNRKRKILLHYS